MKRKLLSIITAIAIISTVNASSAFARAGNTPAGDDAAISGVPARSATAKVDPNPRLKSDMQKLVSDAKAGKVAPRPQQLPSTQRSNLATAAKIGIIVGIAGIVIAIIAIHSANND
ncbi:MAG TPA: hypothetical protein VFU37_06160 [Pyrinomonadaceae bacterium]|nr:hypothetical protein [Pyrinomonadaceae bacterium]